MDIMAGVYAITEHDDLIGRELGFQLLVLFGKGSLCFLIELPWYERGLLVDETQAVEQFGNAVDCIVLAIAVFDVCHQDCCVSDELATNILFGGLFLFGGQLVTAAFVDDCQPVGGGTTFAVFITPSSDRVFIK